MKRAGFHRNFDAFFHKLGLDRAQESDNGKNSFVCGRGGGGIQRFVPRRYMAIVISDYEFDSVQAIPLRAPMPMVELNIGWQGSREVSVGGQSHIFEPGTCALQFVKPADVRFEFAAHEQIRMLSVAIPVGTFNRYMEGANRNGSAEDFSSIMGGNSLRIFQEETVPALKLGGERLMLAAKSMNARNFELEYAALELLSFSFRLFLTEGDTEGRTTLSRSDADAMREAKRILTEFARGRLLQPESLRGGISKQIRDQSGRMAKARRPGEEVIKRIIERICFHVLRLTGGWLRASVEREGAAGLFLTYRIDREEGIKPMKYKFLIMFLIVMTSMISIASFNPVIAPLSRSLGMTDFQSGCLVSVAGLFWLLGGYYWERSAWLGRKATMLFIIAAYLIVLIAFAVLAEKASKAEAVPHGLFWTFLLLRALAGFFFGGIPAKAQAYVMSWTTDQTRTKGMVLFGVANGLGFVLGPALSGGLASQGLTAPMGLAAGMLLVAGSLFGICVQGGEGRKEIQLRDRGVLSPIDVRIRRYLGAGLALSVVLNIVQVTISIFMQDTADYDPIEATRRVGIGLAVSGILVALSQALIGKYLRWPPERSLRVGLLFVALGLLGFLTSEKLAYPAFAALGLGIGMTMLGYSSGASLAASAGEQRSVASYVAALQGGGSFIGPAVGTGLYTAGASWPYAICAALLVAWSLLFTARREIRFTES